MIWQVWRACGWSCGIATACATRWPTFVQTSRLTSCSRCWRLPGTSSWLSCRSFLHFFTFDSSCQHDPCTHAIASLFSSIRQLTLQDTNITYASRMQAGQLACHLIHRANTADGKVTLLAHTMWQRPSDPCQMSVCNLLHPHYTVVQELRWQVCARFAGCNRSGHCHCSAQPVP